jgi:uncharacterized protein (TIGR02599 family)
MRYSSFHPSGRLAGFTLVEVLVSTALIVLLAGMLLQTVQSTSDVWRSGRSKVEQFREARDAFESMTRRLSTATLNTYYDYLDSLGKPRITYSPNAVFTPQTYGRYSELRFISGPTEQLVKTNLPFRPTHGVFFQAPIGFVEDYDAYGGLEYLINTWGYFIEFGEDTNDVPMFLRSGGLLSQTGMRPRFRLMELREPSENLRVYRIRSSDPRAWFVDPVTMPVERSERPVRKLADNIVALVLLPRLAKDEKDQTGKLVELDDLAPKFLYDSLSVGEAGSPNQAHLNSKHQLPPVMQVTMVAIDEPSAARLAAVHGSNPPDLGLGDGSGLFENAIDLEPSEGKEGDLQRLEQRLQDRRLTYRIFTTSVTLRGAKWSRSHTR